jgi:hypothetical protein
MNCNPAVEGKRIMPNTCYTKDAINQMKNELNSRNLGIPKIVSNDEEDIYKEIELVTKCKGKKEDCLLSLLPSNIKDNLVEGHFAPYQPREWRKNSHAWLSNYDIMKVLKQYETRYSCFKLFGPTPIDFDKRLPEENNKCVTDDICNFSLNSMIQNKKFKIGIVFNLSEHDEDGSHWTSLFVDVKHNFIFYFDSAVNEIPDEVNVLIKRIKQQGKDLNIDFKFYTNRMQHQLGNSECGMYSLFFIVTMLTEKSEFFKKKTMTLDDKIKLFQRRRISDKYVHELRKKYFNTDVYEPWKNKSRRRRRHRRRWRRMGGDGNEDSSIFSGLNDLMVKFEKPLMRLKKSLLNGNGDGNVSNPTQ